MPTPKLILHFYPVLMNDWPAVDHSHAMYFKSCIIHCLALNTFKMPGTQSSNRKAYRLGSDVLGGNFLPFRSMSAFGSKPVYIADV